MAEAPPSLQAYLGEHERSCPSCGYRLRELTSDACPECGTHLSLVLRGDAERREGFAPFVAAVAGLAAAFGLGWLGVVVGFATGDFDEGITRFLIALSLVAVVLVVVLCVVWRRVRLEPAWLWWLAAAMCWLVPIVGSFVLFAILMGMGA